MREMLTRAGEFIPSLKTGTGLLGGAGLVDKVTMAVSEVRKLDLGVVKQAAESELKVVKQAVESAAAGAGVVWDAEVNMVDFRLEYDSI